MQTYLSSCLGNTEKCKSECQETKDGEKDVGAIGDGIKHIWSDKSNDTVHSVLG